MEKIKEFEKEYDCLVYAVTHEYLTFGECYAFLYVSDCEEEWENTIIDAGSQRFYTYAYVWNVDDDNCSEFGMIGVHSFGGGIRRIA